MIKHFQKSLILLAVSAILIAISYFLIDRQLVRFLVSNHAREYSVLKIFANDFVIAIIACIFIFFLYFFIKLGLDRLSNFDKKFIITCVAATISLFLKNILKIIFGRTWAATFVCNNPSLISNHAYGFHWFHSGRAYASFPSGHTAFIFAFAISLWFLFPKLRYLWLLIALCVAIGQIGMYFHFLSDVIAGATLGGLVGFYSTHYRCERPIKT